MQEKTDFLVSRQSYLPGSGQVQDPKRFHQLDELFHFLLITGDFNGQVLVLDVDDFGPKDVGNLHDFGTGLGCDGDFDQDQFPIDVFAVSEVAYFNGFDQFFKLSDDLVDRGVIAAGDDRHTRDFGIMGGRHVKRIDVIAPAAEQPGHTGQHSKLVLH